MKENIFNTKDKNLDNKYPKNIFIWVNYSLIV